MATMKNDSEHRHPGWNLLAPKKIHKNSHRVDGLNGKTLAERSASEKQRIWLFLSHSIGQIIIIT
jgi:hypothetical protein